MTTDLELKLYDPFIVDNLFHLPEMCIFGLINEENKLIMIYRTKNIVTALARIINEYKYSNKTLLKYSKLVIIEEIKDPNNLWVRYSFWNKEYSNKGYIIGNKCRYNIRYKLRKQILRDFRRKYDTHPLFYVKVVSSRYKEIVVGVFDKVDDMDAFITEFYPHNGLINNIVYSNNRLTKEYYVK